MKRALLIIVTLMLFSCNAQEDKINIKGNWYIEANKGLDSFTYSEVFINDKTINIYDDFMGHKAPYDYTQEKNNLYILINGEKIKHSYITAINKNTISFDVEDGSRVIYKRIIEGSIKLEDLLLKNPYNEKHKIKYEEDYLEEFNKRKKKVMG